MFVCFLHFKEKLIKFEEDIKRIYETGKIKAPIHLSGNNEDPLIKIFKKIKKKDWVFSTWRNHYHALLHGISPDWLKKEIILDPEKGLYSRVKDLEGKKAVLSKWAWLVVAALTSAAVIGLSKLVF